LPSRYVPTDRKLDGGGMSDTIVCDDQHLDRLVVVKKLAAGIGSRRILDELAALQTIRSKHVVQIYDVIRDKKGAVTAIVEEYLPGKDLTAVQAPTNAPDFLRLAYPIAEGIADVHRHNVVHRDIKRQNMKFDAENCLKIFDFGLARNSTADASTIGAMGTRGYMAPELFPRGESDEVFFTAAVDTFAFAATLLAVLLGKPPAGLRQVPPRLPCKEADFASFPLGLAPEIADILNLCLHPDATERPLMSEVARLVGRHLLRDQHRALLVSRTNIYELHKDQRVVRLSVNGQGSLTIRYDGLRFITSDVSGDVAVNNIAIANGKALPGSCVIVLGSTLLGPRRTMITVDVSHPEVAT
jgi:serine/threonine-protein kinase